MEPPVDLEALLRDESATIEWKRNVADASDVVRTLTAFANDLNETGRGGHVICGVEETRDEHGHKIPIVLGLDSAQLQKVRGRVTAECLEAVHPPITPRVILLPAPDPARQVLVFHVEATGRLHETHYKGQGSKFWVRVDDDTKEARGTILRDLLNRKRHEVPFLDLPCSGGTMADLSMFALEEFVLDARLPLPPAEYLNPLVPFAEGARPLVFAREIATGKSESVPTNLAVVLFGRRPTERLPGAYARFSVYPGRDRATQHSYLADIFGPAPKIIRDLLGALQPYTGLEIDKTTTVLEGQQNRERYSLVALQEAIVNAMAHRDYQDQEPVRVTVFVDRIEISSPGQVLPGIDFAHPSGPKWRNAGLSAFLRKLQLAQAEGQGIPKIIRETERVAERPPVFDADASRVLVTIPAYQPSLPPPSPRPSPPTGAVSMLRDGIVLISIGAASLRSNVISWLDQLGLSQADLVLDLSIEDTVEPDSDAWAGIARKVRVAVASCVEDPRYERLHLFYRGPVILPPVIGAVVAGSKPLVVYGYAEGRYHRAYTLDRRLLRSKE